MTAAPAVPAPSNIRPPVPPTPGPPTVTVYISIGNSDDKLSQREWARFYSRVSLAVREYAKTVHGQWVSEPAAAYQNACWCAEFPRTALIDSVQQVLRGLASEFQQDAIAWDEAPRTRFLGPAGAP